MMRSFSLNEIMEKDGDHTASIFQEALCAGPLTLRTWLKFTNLVWPAPQDVRPNEAADGQGAQEITVVGTSAQLLAD